MSALEATEEELTEIQTAIQQMNKHNQIEVGKILLLNDKNKINENMYGIFVNLTELDYSVIQKLNGFIEYSKKQENNLSQIENEKDIFRDKFFSTS